MGTREDSINSSNNEERYSIIRNREMLNYSTGGPGLSSYGESSDDCYGVASDSDIILKEPYKNDAKLRKRCAVVMTPTKEMIQYERKRDKMYNEILQKQRRKLELRALEKQREKEQRRLDRWEEKIEKTKLNSGVSTAPLHVKGIMSRTRNYNEFCMSSESEYESNFELRIRKPRQQNFKELKPLNIQVDMSEATTTTLLSQIESHLDKPASEKRAPFELKEQANNNDDNNRQTSDANSDKSPIKMRELNLLADIAQSLSPYQLDLPANNNPSITPTPAPEPLLRPPLPPVPQTPNDKEVPKEKITITEQLVIESLDNLLEKRKPQLDTNDQQQQASTSYAHEPKLNTAAIFKSSPCANLLQNQQNNTQLESNDNNNFRISFVRKEITPKTLTDETLEQMLEESINVLKSVPSPYNPSNDCTAARQQTRFNSTIPILISNVESLNQFEQTDFIAKPKSDNKLNLFLKDTKNSNSENFVLVENEILEEETNEKTKDFIQKHNGRNGSSAVLSSNISNSVETSIICAADLSNVPNESEISQTAQVITPSMAADISLESEISNKHLPEIADPSPVVTDMSDNSNESVVSKTFAVHIPINNNNNSCKNASNSNEISTPDLSLVMLNISQHTTLPTSQALESNFNQLNCSLNTPTKLDVGMSRVEDIANNSTNDLNTPLKYTEQQLDLESSNMPLKTTLEPEADNNVTKFLDLILNKTVTDAESETRDKIIKELNALTADTRVASDTTNNNNCNNEIITESKINEEGTDKSIATEVKTVEKDISIEENANVLTTNSTTDHNKSHQSLEFSSSSHIENNSTAIEISDESKCSPKEQNNSQTPSANNDLNPPKENLKETHTQLFSDISTAELPATLDSTSSSPSTQIKSLATKQTLNIKCRVRLKRVNLDENNRTTKNESWMTIPITKPIEPLSSNTDITKCDNATVKTLPNKKPCLKHNNKHTNKETQDKMTENIIEIAPEAAAAAAAASDVMPTKKPKLEVEKSMPIDATLTSTSQQLSTQTMLTQSSQSPAALMNNSTSTPKSKTKPLKTVTFDLSNLNEELRDSQVSNHKQKSKSHAAGIAASALGCYLKSSRPSRKLPDNTLRAAETLQMFVNTINDSARTPPPAEFNKKRSPIKNKCIAEDETPRPPPPSTLMGTPPCKKTCIEKSRSQTTTSKYKDQLVSSLTTASISSITSDITTARIYTSSPLDQTLPEYDDNVDTVANSELILPNTTGSLRRKLKRPKKSMSRPEPADDVNNQHECNGEDDTDAVADNEDDVFAEELLPIPATNEHILEEIVSARPAHIGTGTVIRDDYMNIEATATVPVYLFNDESRDLGSPDVIQSSDNTGIVDSSSYLKAASSTATSNVVPATPASTASAIGNSEKSMLSPSEHEVSSTQETFYQTPTKNKQTEIFGEKSATSKDKGKGGSGSTTNSILKQNSEDSSFNKEEYQTSSNIGLLQNNQVDTTNHSPEMCTLALTATTATTTTLTSNRKIRKASTHDEILFNELQQQQQQQLPSNKRKSNTTFCVESTSDNKNNAISKTKVVQNNLEDIKSNGSLAKVGDKFKKLLKEVCKKDKTQTNNELDVGLASNISSGEGGGGGSSPSTTTTINEDKLSQSKRKKLKSSKSSKTKSQNERSSKIVLKASKLTPHIPAANPLKITIPKFRLLKPPLTPPTQIHSKEEQEESEFLDILKSKLFIEKDRETIKTAAQNINQQNHTAQSHSIAKKELINDPSALISKSKGSHSFGNSPTEFVKPIKTVEVDMLPDIHNSNSKTAFKGKSSSSNAFTSKKQEKVKTANSTSFSTPTDANSCNKNLIFVKDKYDLIKSKDKHHHHYQHQNDNKDKSKDKASSQSKSITSINTRLHKSSSKEKIKGEKSKEKHHKDTEETIAKHQTDNILKTNISMANNNKSLSFASFIATTSSSTTSSKTTTTSSSSFSTNNAKQSNSKSIRNKSSPSLSSPSPLPYLDILKSKTNLTTTQSATATGTVVSAQITTATPSTNNVRKKLKIK